MLYAIFIYTLCKAKILSINFVQLYVILQVCNSPFYISDNCSLMMTTLHSWNTITTTKFVHSQVVFLSAWWGIPYYERVIAARCFVQPLILFILFLLCVTGMTSNENVRLQNMLYREDKHQEVENNMQKSLSLSWHCHIGLCKTRCNNTKHTW